ncbi:hypothetical protein [Sediminicoccus sp. KRV36]|uniref:hypothetical protein n=1 Tax=Sediminicoccus sp. KRV36 TaxID=3133721 RepID=UPI00200D682B|nr:hypothetical protein [Sediminicoccus rosea]UPY37363.1 hypothetical protein LHU95_01355 [Sediminicoccus rosea]
MKAAFMALGLGVSLLGACASEPPGAALPAGAQGSPLDAGGRALGPFQGPAFSVGQSLSIPGCLVVFRSGADFPLSLQTPGAQVAIGGDCPASFWQATAASAEDLGLRGRVNIQGIGACLLPQGPSRPGSAPGCY